MCNSELSFWERWEVSREQISQLSSELIKWWKKKRCIRAETEIICHSTKMFQRPLPRPTGGTASENKDIGIKHSSAFECTMRNYIAQRRDGVTSADKQSKSMDIWGDLYTHFQTSVDTKVKGNKSTRCGRDFSNPVFLETFRPSCRFQGIKANKTNK